MFNVPLAFNYRVPRCLQGPFYIGLLVAPDVFKNQTGSNFIEAQKNSSTGAKNDGVVINNIDNST